MASYVGVGGFDAKAVSSPSTSWAMVGLLGGRLARRILRGQVNKEETGSRPTVCGRAVGCGTCVTYIGKLGSQTNPGQTRKAQHSNT